MSGKRKILILVLSVAAAAAVIITVLMLKPWSRRNNGVELLDFSVGQKLEGYSVWDSQGKELDVSDISNKQTLVVFAMKGCRDCTAEFDSYSILFPLFNSSDFSVVFVWDKDVPQEELDKLNIPKELSYSARGKYKFTDWVPSYYMVNENNEITMRTPELSEAVEGLPEINVGPDQLEAFTKGKPVLLGIDMCGACKNAREQLANDGTDCQYIIQGEKGENSEDGVLYDPHKIASKAFGVSEYPIYVYKDAEGNISVEEK